MIPGMKILDWYILKKFLKSYVFVVSVIEAVVVIINITEQNENFLKHELGLKEIAGYYLDYIPYIASMIAPITVFITVVFITSQLAQHSEIIAMLSNGISFNRILRPYMIGATLIAIVSFYFGGWIIPNSNKDRVAFELQYMKGTYNYNQRDIHIKVGPESYLYMYHYNVNSNVGSRFTLETIEGTEVKERLKADNITWQPETEDWQLKNWSLRKFNGIEETYTYGKEMDTTLRIQPKDFSSSYNRFETLTMTELNDYIDELSLRGADDIQIYQIERYIRFTSPFAAIVLTFIGLCVSARKSRGGAGFQIALGFLLAFIYIIFFIFSRTSAEAGTINPLIAIWIPNAIFSAIGLFLYRSVPK